jgi:hypothetical protein
MTRREDDWTGGAGHRTAGEGRRRLSVILLSLGLVVGLFGGIGTATHAHDLLATTDATIQRGDDFTVRMDPGRWAVYQYTGTEHTLNLGVFHGSSSSEFTAPSFNIRSTGPGGVPLPLTPEPGNETQSVRRGDKVFTAEAQMSVVSPGPYRFRIATADGAPTELLIAPTVGTAIRSVLPWGITLLLGLGILVAGLVLFLIDRTNRRQHPPAARGRWAAPPPP